MKKRRSLTFSQTTISKLQKEGENEGKKYEAKNKSQVHHPKPKHNKSSALDRAIQREKKSSQRIIIRATSFRVRPLDPDNLFASFKNLIDGLRYAGLIPGDEPWEIQIIPDQKPVNTYQEEYTELEIDYNTEQKSCSYCQKP